MRWARFSILAASLLPCFAASWIVPLAENLTSPAGTHYATDLRLFNPGTQTANITLELLPNGSDAPATATKSTLAGGSLTVMTNVLSAAWGISERRGALRV